MQTAHAQNKINTKNTRIIASCNMVSPIEKQNWIFRIKKLLSIHDGNLSHEVPVALCKNKTIKIQQDSVVPSIFNSYGELKSSAIMKEDVTKKLLISLENKPSLYLRRWYLCRHYFYNYICTPKFDNEMRMQNSRCTFIANPLPKIRGHKNGNNHTCKSLSCSKFETCVWDCFRSCGPPVAASGFAKHTYIFIILSKHFQKPCILWCLNTYRPLLLPTHWCMGEQHHHCPCWRVGLSVYLVSSSTHSERRTALSVQSPIVQEALYTINIYVYIFVVDYCVNSSPKMGAG